ncbi:hypothetical protein I2483_12455 [Sporosarcina sp. E16_3]|uniref:hypothetical protein n=1 Tax=Sporosarcina sp. E16_3 TaxID=2789293 RepID=UPI001A92F286|nr:hypothetical protein [Sporosarcina sp. E16_3]MBO0602470.1 hypothetical protein [Sporosarcina sp. E16_3]
MNTEMIHSLVDRVIKVDRGGPESRVGKLLAAEEDYITLLNAEEGIIYYNTQHIKSLTYNAKDQVELDVDIPKNFTYIQAKDFKGVLGKLTLRWVKINRGGPETLEGIMDIVTDDFVTIVANEEIIRVSLFHIRNISYGVKIDKVKKAGESNQGKTKENNKQKDA